MVDLSDLKQHLNMTGGGHDGELVEILDAAIELAQSVAGRYFYRGTATETLDASGVLSYRPVVSIDSVTAAPGYSLGVYEFNGTVARGLRTGSVVTYTYGQVEPTPAQRMGVLLIAAHLWETQRGTAPTALQAPEDGGGQVPGFGFAVPNRARDLLRPPSALSGIA